MGRKRRGLYWEQCYIPDPPNTNNILTTTINNHVRRIGIPHQVLNIKEEDYPAEVEREAGEAKKKVVRNFKATYVPTEIIMRATGLSREEVDDV